MDKSNERIADFFRTFADLLEISGDNPFKTRSYRVAADSYTDMQESVARIARSGGVEKLQEIEGIGKSIASQTLEFVATGTTTPFEQRSEILPVTVVDLLHVRGVGIKMAQKLSQEFKILSLDDLVAFADGGGLEAVPGIGERGVERIATSTRSAAARLPWMKSEDARALAEQIADRVRTISSRPVLTGELRRGRLTVRRIELLAVTEDGERIANSFATYAAAGDLQVQIPSRSESELPSGVHVVMHIALPAAGAATLVRTTGSARHVLDLAARAEGLGLVFKGSSLTPKAGGEPLEIADERQFYDALRLDYIKPEEREGTGEIESHESHE